MLRRLPVSLVGSEVELDSAWTLSPAEPFVVTR